MTEEDAKTRWCPHARVAQNDPRAAGVGWNRVVEIDGVARPSQGASCIASACAAWRWDPELVEANGLKAGFCGLAGAPL